MKLYIKRDRPDSSTPLFDWATPDEIKLAHPKCGECRHINEHLVKYGTDRYHNCSNDESPCYGNEVMTTDYCNAWGAK